MGSGIARGRVRTTAGDGVVQHTPYSKMAAILVFFCLLVN